MRAIPPTMPPAMAPPLEGPGLDREAVELALEVVSGKEVVVSDDDGEVVSSDEASEERPADGSGDGVEDSPDVAVAVTFHGADASEMIVKLV